MSWVVIPNGFHESVLLVFLSGNRNPRSRRDEAHGKNGVDARPGGSAGAAGIAAHGRRAPLRRRNAGRRNADGSSTTRAANAPSRRILDPSLEPPTGFLRRRKHVSLLQSGRRNGSSASALQKAIGRHRLSPAIRWLTGFGLLTFLFLWAERTHWFARTVLPSLSFLSAGAAHHGLSLLGIPTQWNGEVLQTADASFEIAGSCTGAAVMLMYAAAVLPFPASWKHRLAGALAGMFALFALNTVRAVLIVAVGSRFPQAVWGLHVIVGQALVIAGAMALFFLWAGSSRTGHVPGLGPGLRAPAVFLALFLLGFLGSYAIYRELLQSPLGRWTQEKVVAHAAWLLSWTGQASARELVLKTSSGTVRLIQGCLSSPLVVVASAVAFAWPAPWWKKLALISLGFVPFYYFYHLLRTVAVVMVLSAQGGGKELNTAYNFRGSPIGDRLPLQEQEGNASEIKGACKAFGGERRRSCHRPAPGTRHPPVAAALVDELGYGLLVTTPRSFAKPCHHGGFSDLCLAGPLVVHVGPFPEAAVHGSVCGYLGGARALSGNDGGYGASASRPSPRLAESGHRSPPCRNLCMDIPSPPLAHLHGLGRQNHWSGCLRMMSSYLEKINFMTSRRSLRRSPLDSKR